MEPDLAAVENSYKQVAAVERVLDDFEAEVLRNDVRLSSTEYLDRLDEVVEKMPMFQRTKRALMVSAQEAFSSPNFYGKNPNLDLPNLYEKANLLLLYPAIAKSDAKNPLFVTIYSRIQKHARIINSRTVGKDRERRLQNMKTVESVQRFTMNEDEIKSRRGLSLGGFALGGNSGGED